MHPGWSPPGSALTRDQNMAGKGYKTGPASSKNAVGKGKKSVEKIVTKSNRIAKEASESLKNTSNIPTDTGTTAAVTNVAVDQSIGDQVEQSSCMVENQRIEDTTPPSINLINLSSDYNETDSVDMESGNGIMNTTFDADKFENNLELNSDTSNIVYETPLTGLENRGITVLSTNPVLGEIEAGEVNLDSIVYHSPDLPDGQVQQNTVMMEENESDLTRRRKRLIENSSSEVSPVVPVSKKSDYSVLQSAYDKLKNENLKLKTEYYAFKDSVNEGNYLAPNSQLLDELTAVRQKLEGAFGVIENLKKELDRANEEYEEIRSQLQEQISNGKSEICSLKLQIIGLKDTIKCSNSIVNSSSTTGATAAQTNEHNPSPFMVPTVNGEVLDITGMPTNNALLRSVNRTAETSNTRAAGNRSGSKNQVNFARSNSAYSEGSESLTGNRVASSVASVGSFNSNNAEPFETLSNRNNRRNSKNKAKVVESNSTRESVSEGILPGVDIRAIREIMYGVFRELGLNVPNKYSQSARGPQGHRDNLQVETTHQPHIRE